MDPEPSNTGAGSRKESTVKVPSKDPKKKDDKKDEDLVNLAFSLLRLPLLLLFLFRSSIRLEKQSICDFDV